MTALQVTNIQKSFGKTKVLRGVDFTLEEGKVLSVIGPSGGGKTTLLRCITGLEIPDTGKIEIDGEVIFDSESKQKLSRAEKRRRQLKMGLVFQQYHLFPQYTALQNITLACDLISRDREDYKKNKAAILAENRAKGEALLAKVGLSDKAGNYPCQLSGGQQQRVAIARALALSPRILCFDEPTSALDPELTIEVLSVMRDLAAESMTMVVVTHEMSFARDISDEIIFMDSGVAAVRGTPDQVFGVIENARLDAFLGHMRSEGF